MDGTFQRLDELAKALEREGAEPFRVNVVRRAQRFKRSWVEMAEALVRVRRTGAYRTWGYEDFHTYCATELQIRRATADKLTVSFVALEKHAPEQLTEHSEELPGVDSVGYFAKALGVTPAQGDEEPPEDAEGADPLESALADELRRAVFDEGAPVAVLRRRFDPVLYPKPEGSAEVELLEKTDSAAKRLATLLGQLEGLPRRVIIEAEDAVDALRDEIAKALPKLRDRIEKAS